jgi:tetratricopeptide (TPR) repeat protein
MEEAINLLENVEIRSRDLPDQSLGALPLVGYTLGWLHAKCGNQKAALKCYRRASKASADYCFPARLEEIDILEPAITANPADARAPYYLGNLLYDRRRHEEAMRHWESSAALDPGFSIVWRNLGIGSFNIGHDARKARNCYDKAFAANPSDARLLYERDQLWKRLGESPSKRLNEMEKHPELVSSRDDLSIELCALCNQTGRHRDALDLVSCRNFQPWEGGEGGPLGQWVRSHLMIGREALNAGEPAKAGEHFTAALNAPPNLGEAKHLLANQSDIHYWLGRALAAAGESEPLA